MAVPKSTIIKLFFLSITDIALAILSEPICFLSTLIPALNLKKIKKVIGKNTISSVRSGFFWGYIGLINNIIELIKKETRKPFKIIITGGFSHLFATSIYKKAIISKDITINGLIKATDLIK